jgi:uroporphyrinogen decarboxylase
MNNRERAMAILHYEDYDRMPVVHFGYWPETLHKWAGEGHLTEEQAKRWGDGNTIDAEIAEKLGFDFGWYNCLHPETRLLPAFEEKVVEKLPDGGRAVLTGEGVVILRKPGATSIPTEIDHLLKDRASWEEHYLPRLQYSEERVAHTLLNVGGGEVTIVGRGGGDYLREGQWECPYGLECGSLYGVIRNWWGLVGLSYLQADDPVLFDEVIDTVGELCYRVTERTLEVADTFDFGHFWEDISFKNGPLVNPELFAEKVGPHYRRITDLLREHGIDLVSLDSDGNIDKLLPVWLENGVNTMFPIEVGTWHASIGPWRAKYGKELRGVGGMDKKVFAYDYAAIDAEIERLKPLVDLGGYIPCPDHRIAPDAEWANVQYYCERMREAFPA